MATSNQGNVTGSIDTTCATFLTTGQTLGLFITAEVGLSSAIAVLFLFSKIARNVLRYLRHVPKKDWQFFSSPLNVYMLSLFIADLLQSIGFILNFKWVAQGVVRCSAFCTAQGAIQELGETGVAMATLETVHTFSIIVFRKGLKALLLATIVVCFIWLYLLIFVIVGVTKLSEKGDGFYTPTPYWCWVGSAFPAERIAGEYFWIWFTAIVSLGLYVPLFFFLRGNITVDHKERRVRFHRRSNIVPGTTINERASQVAKHPAREALMMLLYPVCYVAVVSPLSIGRWINFARPSTHPIPSAVNFAVDSIFGLSGLVNVILIIKTRPGLLLLSDTPENPSSTGNAEPPMWPLNPIYGP